LHIGVWEQRVERIRLEPGSRVHDRFRGSVRHGLGRIRDRPDLDRHVDVRAAALDRPHRGVLIPLPR